MSLSPPHLRSIQPYEPGMSAEALERELGIAEAVKLASNENPMGPSPRAVAAMAAAAAGVNRYPDSEDRALRARLSQLHGVPAEEVFLAHGSNVLIDLLCRTYGGPGRGGVVSRPSFSCYALSLRVAGAELTEVPAREGIFHDVDGLLSAVRTDTRLVFLDNPNNPTSTHVGRADLERLLRGLPHHVVPVIDEAYVRFADAPDYASALRLRTLHPNLVVLNTFSKAHGLAAARVGYAIAPEAILEPLWRVRPPFSVGAMAQAGALAALDDEAFVRDYVALNREQRVRLTAQLEGLGLGVAPSQANFLHVSFPRPARAIYEALLRKGVIVRPLQSETTLRISVGLPAENQRLMEALRAL